MRVPIIYKRIGNYIIGTFFTCLCLLGTTFMTKDDATLDEFMNAKGILLSKGITEIKASRGMIDAMCLKMQYVDRQLIYSKPNERYWEFLNQLNVGDTINVYFKPHKNSYFEIFQLEKGQSKLIRLDDYNRNNKIAGYMSLTAAIFMIGFMIYNDKKYWR